MSNAERIVMTRVIDAMYRSNVSQETVATVIDEFMEESYQEAAKRLQDAKRGHKNSLRQWANLPTV